MSGFEERVVIVTGGGGGLGREYALTLANQGARIVVNDLGGARDGSGSGTAMADGVVEEIRAAGGSAVPNYDNIATPEGAQALIKTAVDEFGTVHGIVSNAGILRDGAFHKMAVENWDSVLKVHLYGAYFVTRAAWDLFREQKFGRVVVASSTSGLFGNFGQANYSAAKLGLIGLVNTLAAEGAKYNITANAIAPLAATRMTEDIAPAEALSQLSPEFVAPVVAHLLHKDCTDTAAVLVAGGGRVYRVAQFQNQGVTFTQPPSVDEVAANWSAITDLGDVVPARDPFGSGSIELSSAQASGSE
ncbi:SDR family NAD(P)-dependent oxidoreductase [Rhodococcus sp. BE178]|uniref:SDR family NAD(P)-dependent oxidoreductase n=1 Tax=Rhodococcus sp. BE178 TaxID=2817737 RepID=UPI003D1C82FF